MKRILTILAIMLLPLSLWAMTPITDSDLSSVTGQAGVSINPDMTMDITINTMAWGDNDGIHGPINPWSIAGTDGGNRGGYIGLNSFNISNLKVRLRTETDDVYNGFGTGISLIKPITIDVATGGASDGLKNGRTFVRFGLGALQISLDELTFDVALGSHGTYGGSPTLNQTMGVVTLGAMDIYMNPASYVDIYNHRTASGSSGVTFDLSVTIDRLKLPYMSWGDKDGLAAGVSTSANGVTWLSGSTDDHGYIGLADFRLGDGNQAAVSIIGSVAIDIATANHGTYPDLNFLFDHLPHYGSQADVLAALLVDFGGYLTTYGLSHDAQGLHALMASGALNVQSIINGLMGAGFYAYVTPISVVHISFPTNLEISMAKMVGRVILADNAQLNYSAGSLPYTPAACTNLGDMYIQNLNVTIGSGSWVDIWAH